MKTLWLICGAPGTGKSHLALILAKDLPGDTVVLSADDYFTNPVTGEYTFAFLELKRAHRDCRARTEYHMSYECENVIVHNTFTQHWERAPYYNLAERYGYFVQSVHLRNIRPEGDIHNVPIAKVDQLSGRHEFTS